MDILQLLPRDVYDAAVGANAPSAGNVFATMADLGGGGVNIYNTNGSLTANRILTLNAFDLLFVGTSSQFRVPASGTAQFLSNIGTLRGEITVGATSVLFRSVGLASNLILGTPALSSGDVSIQTDATERLRVISTGEVGIGLGVTPTSLLTVDGDIETLTNTRGIIVLDRTNATRYRIYTDGGVLFTEPA